MCDKGRPDLRAMYAAGELVTDVETAGRALGIGRGHSYSLARSNELPGVMRLGSRYVVSVPALLRAVGALRDGTAP
jgi:hypothetical protein